MVISPLILKIQFLILFILFYPLRVLAINNTNKESSDMSTRSIAKIVTANEQAEGAGARVRRSIGIMNQRNFDPFLMFDHFSSAGTNGFPEHPHRGQETILRCQLPMLTVLQLLGCNCGSICQII